jgi:para-nitrobenzyl esterase
MTGVTTSYGTLRGAESDGLSVFRGIPFAAPPTGELRFRPSQRAASWEGARDATSFAPAAMQRHAQLQQSAFGGMFGPGELPVDEDCLYLNVWTPGVDGARRPAMVFIHGGGFRTGTGASPMYDGSALARRGDIVVVTINYRLGAFGFVYAEDLGGTNFGVLDQVAALEWVRDEIAAFGGDPGNVTIFGESAGGKSVETLLATPAASGLFHRAIAQSSYRPAMDVETAKAAAGRLFEQLGLKSPDPESLRSIPAEELLQAQLRMAEAAPNAGGLVPVIDGDVLPEPTLQAIAGGSVREVPLLAGSNRDESRLFGARTPELAEMDEEALAERLGNLIPGADVDEGLRRTTIEVYRQERERRGERAAPADIWFDASTDNMFRHHSTQLAEAQSGQQRTYSYLFSWRSPAYDGALGACHGLELPFVFRTFDGPLGRLAGDSPAALTLSERMQDAWIAFARSGDPNCDSLPGWPVYDTDRRSTMVLDAECEVQDAPLESIRRFWAGLGG